MLRYFLFICSFLSGVEPLWYNEPAQKWIEALPIGNGRMAAMVYGGVQKDKIQFNEESLWSGCPQDADNPLAFEKLALIQSELFKENYQEAEKLTYENLLCKGRGSYEGKSAYGEFGCYQTFGDLLLEFENEFYQDYRRELDLENGMIRVTYTVGDTHYLREYFISFPNQTLVIYLTSDKPAKINFTASLSRSENAKSIQDEDSLSLSGQLGPGQGIKYLAQLKCYNENGNQLVQDSRIHIKDADSALLILGARTDFRHNNFEALVKEDTECHTYLSLRDAHINDYSSLMNRVDLNVAGNDFSSLPTPQRLKRLREGKEDPQLISQYFQFGRYLLITSSRPGCLPANLQGKWAKEIQTPWNGDYHTNINLQMNYWPAEVANLSECHTPLIDFIKTLKSPGERTAKIHYGARGWVVHHITNIWGFTSPAENPRWGLFPAASGWLCQHLWEHYLYNQDSAYLIDIYPLMTEASKFYLDYLVRDPKSGYLVTAPSSSPENSFYDSEGHPYTITYGPSMDIQIIRDLFSNTIKASQLLGHFEFADKLEIAIAQLPPFKIGKHGQIQEWLEDYDEPEPGHRHISHLFALFPGNQIDSPQLVEGATKTLERRLTYGGGHTSWSQAWISLFWARLKNARNAEEHLTDLIAHSTFPNFFDAHYPVDSDKPVIFQIDGNLGGTAAIAEMLLQSHNDEIDILPCLPPSWNTGSFKGLKARGDVEVDAIWKNHKLTSATLKANRSGKHKIRYKEKQFEIPLLKNEPFILDFSNYEEENCDLLSRDD